MLNKIRNNIFLILLLFIGVFLALKNYTPHTFLSGWDTLHPEFNFGLAFEREINGVFRSEQGLGAVAGHSHMADLPRTIILYFLHFIFPTDTLRYLYVFLNLILGPIGMYFFLNKYVVKNQIGSFLGSLFYLLNLGTMQQFMVPFEMFTTQYALLPWLFLTATNYITSAKNQINKLLLFAFIVLLAAPMAYAATLWHVYFFVFISYILCFSFLNRSFQALKKSFILIFFTLIINSFWLLPNIYYVLNHGREVTNALTNQLFSSQAFLYNKEFGNIKDISLMKNFLFDWNVYAGDNKFVPLLSPWIAHLNQKTVLLTGFFLSIIALTGAFYAVFKKNKILISLLPALLISFFFLINDNPPTAFLYNFLQNKVPLFKEAFRFPDDKVLGIFTFVFALFFAKGQTFLSRFIKFKPLQIGIFLFLLIYFMFPAFKGNLISPYMRIQIPKYYFEAFDWFKNQKDGRIAVLPINSLWGWKYYDWYGDKPSFQGAQFISFGIKQPLLDRDFDRWSSYNEQYYREMSQAIYSKSEIRLNNVLQKYNIKYIFLDKSIIAPNQAKNNEPLLFDETEKLLKRNPNTQAVAHFGSIAIYETAWRNEDRFFLKNPLSISPSIVSYDDFTYFKYKDYISHPDPRKNTIFYPFGNIMDNAGHFLPRLQRKPNGLDIAFTANNQNATYAIQNPTDNIKNYDITGLFKTANDCLNTDKSNTSAKKNVLFEKGNRFVRYSSDYGSFCDHFSYDNLPRNQSYLITITSRNIKGLPLQLCISNYISKRCDLQSYLSKSSDFKEEVFLLPPIDESTGFNIDINNFAIKKSPAINDVKTIQITAFPYDLISKIETRKDKHFSKDKTAAVFFQSFEKGWKAYEGFPFFGKELKEHVLVNNWANGWLLPSSNLKDQNSKIIIVFWPQYLEYLGFVILITIFLWLIYVNFKRLNLTGIQKS